MPFYLPNQKRSNWLFVMFAYSIICIACVFKVTAITIVNEPVIMTLVLPVRFLILIRAFK